MSIMYAIVSALLLIVETGNLWYHKYKTERVVNKTDQKIKEIHTNFKKDYDTISDLIREVIYHNENLDGTNRDMKDELYRLYELLDKYKKELEEDKQPDIVNK